MMTQFHKFAIFATVSLFALAVAARGDDTEERVFSVFIDGKDAGMSRMTLVQKDDGTTYMSAKLDVKFRHLLIAEYVLKVETQEIWKDGRLIGMKTSSSENGKKTEISASAEKQQLRLRVNGLDRYIRADTWTSSYWKLADARFHNKAVPILEVDTGKEYNAELKYVEPQQLKVGDQVQDCFHFRVSSAPGPVDLWFDKYHRLVRQEFTESGHKTIVQLLSIRR
jgi:hypothetical protein